MARLRSAPAAAPRPGVPAGLAHAASSLRPAVTAGDGPPEDDGLLSRCRAIVARYGWQVTYVFADPDTGTPPFAYTTGLWATFSHPELVLTAIPRQAAHGILNAAGQAIAGGRPLDGGTTRPDLANLPVRVLDVDLSRCRLPFGMTNLFYGQPAPVRQLVWPDPDGRFPGDPRCDPQMAALQDIGGTGPATRRRSPPRRDPPHGQHVTGDAAPGPDSGGYAMPTRSGNAEVTEMVRTARSMCGQGLSEVSVLAWLDAQADRIGEDHPAIAGADVREAIASALDDAWRQAYGHQYGMPEPGSPEIT